MASEDSVCKVVVAVTLIAVVIYLSVHLCRSCGLLAPTSRSCAMGAARSNFVTLWGTPRGEMESGGRLPLNISQFTRQGMALNPSVVGVPRRPMHCSPYDLTCGNDTLFSSQGLRLTGSDVLEQTRSRPVGAGAPPRSCPISDPTCGGAQGTVGPACRVDEPCCGNLPSDCYPYHGCYDHSKVPLDQYMTCMAAKDAAAEAQENIRKSRMEADQAAATNYAGETLGGLAVGTVGLRSTGVRRVSTLLQKPVSPSTSRKQVRITPELGASSREFIQPGRITRYSKNDELDRATAGGNVFV